MKKNAQIKAHWDKLLNEKFDLTNISKKRINETIELERTFRKKIESDQELVKQYLQLESARDTVRLEYDETLFCEGLRIGFKLCMDIFEL